MVVHDGDGLISPTLTTLCGFARPSPIFSTGNMLTLHVRAESQHVLYDISYSSSPDGPGCGGNITHFNGSFTSPLYPRVWNMTSVCRWNVRTLGLHSITLGFSQFDFNSANQVECPTNYVEVYDGLNEIPEARVARYCGHEIPAVITSAGPELLVKMVTAGNNTGTGFRAWFNANDIGEFVP